MIRFFASSVDLLVSILYMFETKRSRLESMLQNPRAFIARLGSVPDTRRIDHFLNVDSLGAERAARDLARLNTSDEKLNRAFVEAGKRIDRMAGVYGALAERERGTPLPMRQRNSGDAASRRGVP